MKGFYILAAIAIIVASLLYMAFRESNTDLERRQERLVESMTAVKEILEQSLEPLTRLRKGKTTDRLDKQHHRLRTRVDKAERILSGSAHAIETVTRETRDEASRNLDRISEEVNSLVNEVGIFHSRVSLIDWFVKEQRTARDRINALMTSIQDAVRQRTSAGGTIDGAMKERIRKSVESAMEALRLADETLRWIWEDLEQGKIYAESRINDLNSCLPMLEALRSDLGN